MKVASFCLCELYICPSFRIRKFRSIRFYQQQQKLYFVVIHLHWSLQINDAGNKKKEVKRRDYSKLSNLVFGERDSNHSRFINAIKHQVGNACVQLHSKVFIQVYVCLQSWYVVVELFFLLLSNPFRAGLHLKSKKKKQIEKVNIALSKLRSKNLFRCVHWTHTHSVRIFKVWIKQLKKKFYYHDQQGSRHTIFYRGRSLF